MDVRKGVPAVDTRSQVGERKAEGAGVRKDKWAASRERTVVGLEVSLRRVSEQWEEVQGF